MKADTRSESPQIRQILDFNIVVGGSMLGTMLEDLDRDLIQIAFLAGQIEAVTVTLAFLWLRANHQCWHH